MAVKKDMKDLTTRANMAKSAKNGRKTNKKVMIVAHEIKLAKVLAGNNKPLRERTLKRLKKWFSAREFRMAFCEDDFMRIWKGLFYYMWMSDKPLIQEECANNIAQLVDFAEDKTSLLFFKCFLRTMINEWFGIDNLRLDKFLMLVRRVLRQCLQVLRKTNWDEEHVKLFQEILNETALKVEPNIPLSFTMHVTEIFLEELAKVSKGEITENIVLKFLEPFAWQLANLKDGRQTQHIKRHIFRYMMRQSDEGMEYHERFDAWKQQGFPGGNIESMEKIEVEIKEDNLEMCDDNDEDNEPLDPRAGKVNVTLAQLKFDPEKVAEMLLNLRFKPTTNSHSRRALTKLATQFQDLARGEYPLGMKKILLKPKHDGYSTKIKKSLKRLAVFEQQIAGDTKRAKAKKLKKRKVKAIIQKELSENYIDEVQQTNDVESMEDFIARSEGGLLDEQIEEKIDEKVIEKPFKINTVEPSSIQRKKKRLRRSQTTNEANTKRFRRNSGIWEVDDLLVSPDKKNFNDWQTEEVFSTPNNILKKELVKNPFSSAKKVQIALNLNRSQDTREYHESLMSSPGIPYDSNRKPNKPLLKSRCSMPGMLNPFYIKVV